MRPPSLARRIIVALLVYQTVASLLGATLASILDWRRSDTQFLGSQLAVEVIAGAVRMTSDGLLAVEETPELSRLAARNPGLWYVIHDGATMLRGGAPAPITIEHPIFATDLMFAGMIDDRTGLPIVAGRLPSFAGPARLIVVGNVATDNQSFLTLLLQLLRDVIVYVVFPLTLGAILIVGWVIRRVLVGVESAAAAAAAVQPTTIGRRLPEPGVPKEILPLVKAFNAALARLDEGHARQRRFIADAAHELRTPIAVLSTRLDLLPDDPTKDKLKTDVRRLSHLARRLLETESARSPLASQTPLDLVKLAREVAADLAPQAVAAGYEIAFAADLPTATVMADEGAIRGAVVNLVDNAIRHGGGRGCITVSVQSPARLLVADEGPGVPSESRDRIFEPFFRGASNGTGAGLGLCLIQEIARTHGGGVRLVDQDGPGALFELSLPGAVTTEPLPRQGP